MAEAPQATSIPGRPLCADAEPTAQAPRTTPERGGRVGQRWGAVRAGARRWAATRLATLRSAVSLATLSRESCLYSILGV